MIKIKSSLILALFIFFLGFFLLVSCHQNRNAGVNAEKADLKIHRFEKDLFSLRFDDLSGGIAMLESKYPDFLDFFSRYIINIGSIEDAAYQDYLLAFLTDYTVNRAQAEVLQKFKSIDNLEEELNQAFGYYRYYFPADSLPVIYTYTAGFARPPVFIADRMIAIGLDNYLGRGCEFYPMLGWPNYQIKNMHESRIVPDIFQSLAFNEFPYNDSVDNIMGHMIYEGKVLYFTKQMMPDEPDSLIIGYTADEMLFCQNNEEQMWTYLIEHKLLFNSDRMVLKQFVEDGPFTKSFTSQSPARAVTWIGWQIVASFMDKHKDISLKDLMLMNDYQYILQQSRYNP